jgi:large subunit ribosomal protein L31
MKKDIHPNGYKEIEIVLTNGTSFKTRSCYDKSAVLKLDVDPTNHPAWKDKATNFVNTNNNQVGKFERKFGSSVFSYGENKEKADA